MLRIYSVVLDVAREVGVIGRQISRHDSDLARQVRRAMASVPLNLAEGTGQKGGNRTRHYCIALGSMYEVRASVETAAALGYVSDVDPALLNRMDHVCATLFKLTRTAA